MTKDERFRLEKTAERIKNFEATSWHRSLNLFSRTSDLAYRRHHRPTRNCLLSSLPADKVVLRSGSVLEERLDNDSNHPEIPEIVPTANYE
jgi:hypothetical protein